MARILVLGSVARDEVIHLRGPMHEGGHVEGYPGAVRIGGGGANTGGALARAGHDVAPVSAVGDDEHGATMKRELEKFGLDLSLVATVPGGTTHSLVMVDPAGERTIVNLARAREPEPPRRILEQKADCVFVRSRAQDLAPLLTEIGQRCLVVSHMPPFVPGSRPAQVLVVSQSDLEAGLPEDPFVLGRSVAGDMLEWVVVTRGAEGASAHGRWETHHRRAPQVEVKDTTGAGDAFAAGLVHGLVSGLAMEDALEVGCAWGAEATRWETSVLPREAMERLLPEG